MCISCDHLKKDKLKEGRGGLHIGLKSWVFGTKLKTGKRFQIIYWRSSVRVGSCGRDGCCCAKVLKARKLLRPSEVRRALPVPVPPFSFHYSSFSTIYHVSLFKGLDVISTGLLKVVERRKPSKVDWGHGWLWGMWHIFKINLIRPFWCNSWFFKLLAKHFLM